ncbi:alpha/beta fold hydrolase [Comamonas sp. NoAH]|uniref:alpha/beta fold hydrolase n=1 Tax=Comamonas halotolerans TaxID=3041496 RepID=UPI0024E0DDB0|nr:alpha/beta hydrolase [Comamonas sp. NoAH]
MTPLHIEQHTIPFLDGSLFAQIWLPDGAQKAPIVLMHDSLGCVALWRDFPSQLASATGRMVVAYDRLGFGRSSAHADALPMSFVADEAHQGLAQVLQHLGLHTFVVLGHSVGGGMAVCSAAHYPQRCESLITLSAQAFVEARTILGIRAAKKQFSEPGALDRLARYHGDKAGWVLHAWTDTWLSSAFASWSLDTYLRKVRCPALIIHGEQDEFGSAAHPQRIAQGVQGESSMHLLAGCAHMPHKEQTLHCLELIQTHLNR